jgi:hypothetical protein
MALKTDFGILYYEDRRPPYSKLEAEKEAVIHLRSVLGVARRQV